MNGVSRTEATEGLSAWKPDLSKITGALRLTSLAAYPIPRRRGTRKPPVTARSGPLAGEQCGLKVTTLRRPLRPVGDRCEAFTGNVLFCPSLD